jgi:hypothetical protein
MERVAHGLVNPIRIRMPPGQQVRCCPEKEFLGASFSNRNSRRQSLVMILFENDKAYGDLLQVAHAGGLPGTLARFLDDRKYQCKQNRDDRNDQEQFQ